MKKFFLFVFLMTSVFSFSQNLSEFRALMQKGESSETVAKSLLEKSKAEYDKTKLPIYEALAAVGHFFMAKNGGNPISKYSHFNKGKKLLSEAIKKEPKNLEIRFMRYICQEKTPGFLGYKDNLEEDKKFILSEYKNTKDENLKTYIKNYFKL